MSNENKVVLPELDAWCDGAKFALEAVSKVDSICWLTDSMKLVCIKQAADAVIVERDRQRALLATATGLPAQVVDADSLKLLADIRSMVESTIKAGLVDDRELLHTLETIAKTAAKAKRPTCAICDSKGFIAFDDESARGRNGGRWGVCKACSNSAPQAQADARDALPAIKDMQNSPPHLNLNDRAFWVLGWNECRDSVRDTKRAAIAAAKGNEQ